MVGKKEIRTGVLTSAGKPETSVQQHLEMAIQTAVAQGMSSSELMGMFFYYAHNIAQSYREEGLKRAKANPLDPDHLNQAESVRIAKN